MNNESEKNWEEAPKTHGAVVLQSEDHIFWLITGVHTF
jgi:hypothetical protein